MIEMIEIISFVSAVAGGILLGVVATEQKNKVYSRMLIIAYHAAKLRRADAAHEPFFTLERLKQDLFDKIDEYESDKQKGTL